MQPTAVEERLRALKSSREERGGYADFCSGFHRGDKEMIRAFNGRGRARRIRGRGATKIVGGDDKILGRAQVGSNAQAASDLA